MKLYISAALHLHLLNIEMHTLLGRVNRYFFTLFTPKCIFFSVKITPARSDDCIGGNDNDLHPSSYSKVKPGSRKNSIVSFLFPGRSPTLSPDNEAKSKKFLSPGASDSPSKSKGKFLKKTSSVVQLYNSVLNSLRTIAKSNEDIMPELTKKFFEKVLRESEKNDELQVLKVKVSSGKDFGNHFCSEVNSLEVSVKLSKECQESFQLVVKSQPMSEDARKFLSPSRTFEREVEMYSSVLPALARYTLAENKSVAGDHVSDILPIPRCYFTRCEGGEASKDDMIIMENLEKKGFIFITNGDDEEINKAHVEIVIREIAKLHAISYCMKVYS